MKDTFERIHEIVLLYSSPFLIDKSPLICRLTAVFILQISHNRLLNAKGLFGFVLKLLDHPRITGSTLMFKNNLSFSDG